MSDDPRQDAIIAREQQIVAKSAKQAQSSANTDAPSVAATPEPAKPESAPAEPAAVAQTETPESPAAPEASDPEKVAARKRAKQDRIDKLTRRVTERDREIGYLRAQLEAKQAPQPAAPIQPAQTQTPREPQLADFNYDQQAFDDARIEYRLNLKLAERDLQQSRQRQERELQEREGSFKKRLAEFDQKNPGVWAEQVTTAPITTTPPMLEAIFESDIGPEIGVYLAQHVDEANAIARMPPLRAALEMGRLESKIKAQPAPQVQPRTVTKAPAPPPSIQGVASPGRIDWSKATMEDHEKAVRESRQRRFS